MLPKHQNANQNATKVDLAFLAFLFIFFLNKLANKSFTHGHNRVFVCKF